MPCFCNVVVIYCQSVLFVHAEWAPAGPTVRTGRSSKKKIHKSHKSQTKKKLEPAKFLPARGERTGVRTNSKIIFRPLKKKAAASTSLPVRSAKADFPFERAATSVIPPSCSGYGRIHRLVHGRGFFEYVFRNKLPVVASISAFCLTAQ